MCDDPACWRKDIAYQTQKRHEWLINEARQQIPEDWPSSLSVALLPRNTRPLAPLPDSRITSHRQHLQNIVKDARVQYQKGDGKLAETDASRNGISDKDAELPVLSAACGLCGGDCCYTGGNTAWLEAATIQRQPWFEHDIDDQRIVEYYLSYLPHISYQDGCVYQSDRGCTLPRNMRSNVCNQFLCNGLSKVINALNESRGSCVAATTSGSHVLNISLIDALGILDTRKANAE